MHLLKIGVLLLCQQMAAQDIIRTTEGAKITVVEGSIKVEPRNNRLTYQLPNSDKRNKIKFKALSSAMYKDHLIKTFLVEGRRKAFFILADADGKQLGVLPSKRSVSKGGFEVPYKRYEVVVINKDNVVSDYLVFTDVNNPANISLRNQAAELVQQQFNDCPNLIERLKTFENTDSKIENGQIVELLDNPYLISCK